MFREARGHLGRSSFNRFQRVGLLLSFMAIRCCCGLEGRAPLTTYKAWCNWPLPTVKNWRAAFDWPTGGENFLNWIEMTAINLGPPSLRVKGTAKGAEIKFKAPTRQAPRRIIVHLPKARPLTKSLKSECNKTIPREALVMWVAELETERERAEKAEKPPELANQPAAK